MAYFSNSSEGAILDNQCGNCKYGQKKCPIALVQMMYNYDAANNETATEILEELVSSETGCRMYDLIKEVE